MGAATTCTCAESGSAARPMPLNKAQQFRGRGDVIEDCIFEQTNSNGAVFLGPDQVVRRCTFQDNGQLGWGANQAHHLLFTDCVTRRNNIKNFDRGWEAGGDKICMSRGVIIEHSRFENNNGPGVWFDIGNEDCTVKNCLIAENQDAGIFYEISFGLHATDNVITCNGLEDTPALGRLGRHLPVVLPRLRHRAQPDLREQRRFQFP